MKALIVCGLTATGKTGLAAEIAKKFSAALISADSRQVYQDMDIVTGKDRPEGVTILGYDLVKPDEDFSVAHFVNFAVPQIKALNKKGRLPIVVGGTGLWLKALVEPMKTINTPPDQKLRQRLQNLNTEELREELKKVAPQRLMKMNQSDRHNPRRLIRAIEVGKSQQGQALLSARTVLAEADWLWIGLKAPLSVLDERVERRVAARVKAGAVAEWERLKAIHNPALPSMSAIGYRELPDIDRWITAEKQYLRRQLTWFKKIKPIHWFDISGSDWQEQVVSLVSSWYTK